MTKFNEITWQCRCGTWFRPSALMNRVRCPYCERDAFLATLHPSLPTCFPCECDDLAYREKFNDFLNDELKRHNAIAKYNALTAEIRRVIVD